MWRGTERREQYPDYNDNCYHISIELRAIEVTHFDQMKMLFKGKEQHDKTQDERVVQ